MRVFAGKIIRSQLTMTELEDLKADFKQYKVTGILPNTFGRDALYEHPSSLPIILSEKVSHLHLASLEHAWLPHIRQYARTSDTHLVYCQGSQNPDDYLLIAILVPNAHDDARNNNTMYKLGCNAEKFR